MQRNWEADGGVGKPHIAFRLKISQHSTSDRMNDDRMNPSDPNRATWSNILKSHRSFFKTDLLALNAEHARVRRHRLLARHSWRADGLLKVQRFSAEGISHDRRRPVRVA